MPETKDMPDEKQPVKPGLPFGLTPRDVIYGVVTVLGFYYIVSGLNGSLAWGLSDTVVTALGGIIGLAAAFALSWLRKR